MPNLESLPTAGMKVYPNPFSSTTNVVFNVKEAANTTISLYNITGQKVYMVNKGMLSKGLHLEEIRTPNLPSGVYFMKVTTPDFEMNQKVIINK